MSKAGGCATSITKKNPRKKEREKAVQWQNSLYHSIKNGRFQGIVYILY